MKILNKKVAGKQSKLHREIWRSTAVPARELDRPRAGRGALIIVNEEKGGIMGAQEAGEKGAADRAISEYAAKSKKKTLNFLVIVSIIFVAAILFFFLFGKSITNKPVYLYSFDTTTSGWVAMGSPQGTISQVQGSPREGRASGCLQYVYRDIPGSFTGVAKLVPTLEYLAEIRFWLWSKMGGEFVIGLEEEDGSSFIYLFSVQPGQWRHIETTPDYFVINEDSRDENGILDVRDLSSRFFIADVTGLRGKEQDNTFYLDDLVLTRKMGYRTKAEIEMQGQMEPSPEASPKK